jgi:ubiquinone/menaquinone biosynthesis C-methylase UbiE
MAGDIPSLGAGWSAHADEWITWTRLPGWDSYGTFHRDEFLPLVPTAGGLTVDVGCGEGRLSRDLQAVGHRVLAVDLSPDMVRAAVTHPGNPVRAVVADAAGLPLATGSADCAVAFMSLHDIDDKPAAVNEIARVLVAGGRLVIAIVHPINSAGKFAGDKADVH